MQRTLMEVGTIAVCFWVGLYETPIGALVRGVAGSLLGVRTTARPLLSYYSGGIDRQNSAAVRMSQQALPPTRDEALGLGAMAAYSAMPESARRVAAARITHQGKRPEALEDPNAFTAAVKQLENTRQDAEAMLALFAGEQVAAFAKAGAHSNDIETLAAFLPPGFDAEATAAGRALAFGRAYGLGWPLDARVRITSPFGPRTHPVSGKQTFHKGVDLGADIGTEVRAPASGVVVRSSEDAFNGNMVVISHGHGVRTLYLHNAERLVVSGQRVDPGQPIARTGNTGSSTGPHLHYQLELAATPYDPLSFHRP